MTLEEMFALLGHIARLVANVNALTAENAQLRAQLELATSNVKSNGQAPEQISVT